MKRKWMLLGGVLLGLGAGFMLSNWFNQPAPIHGTAFLREFSFPTLVARAGQTNWHVREDRVYEPLPSLARSPAIGRRIVAQTQMTDRDFAAFATRFEQTARDMLHEHEAMNKACFDLVYDTTRVLDNRPVRSRISMPRRYYAIGDVHGVADIGYVAENGQVTVLISLVESL
jgi:hypothetical protein